MPSKPKLLITGSGSFMFGNFIRYAIHNKYNYNFVSIDKVQKHSMMYNVYTNKDHQFHIGDVCDEHFIDVLFKVEKPDIVIHAAGETSVDKSIENPTLFVKSNVLGTQVIINACVSSGVKKLIYISSADVYGHLTDEEQPSWKENAPLNPRNVHSASKAAGELLIKAAHITHGLTYNIIRPCNNFGPRQSADKFIPKIIKSIVDDKPIFIYGQGMQIRDWLYVEDNCEAILKILSDGKENEIYNVSANQELANIEMVQKICNVFGKGHSLIQFVEERLGHDFRYSIDSAKIRNLGWQPKYNLMDALNATVRWYNLNQWFLKL